MFQSKPQDSGQKTIVFRINKNNFMRFVSLFDISVIK